MGSWRTGVLGVFSVNCSDLSLHNSAVLRLRQIGHQWPTTNGDEYVGDLLLWASKTRTHLRGGPSGPYLDGFAAALERQGYSADTAIRIFAVLPLAELRHGRGAQPPTEFKNLRMSASRTQRAFRLCQSNGRVVCAWRSTPRPKRPLGRESAPLGQCAGSSLFVDLASDEMALLIEMVVDLGMN